MIRVRASQDSAERGVFDWQGAAPSGAAVCELVLAADRVALRHLRVPAAQRRRLAGNLRFLVEDLVACDAERVHAVELEASRDEARVGIVDRAWLRAVLERLAERGLRVARAVPETLLAPLEGDGAWTVVWQGESSFARTGAASGFALDSGAPDGVPLALRLAAQAAPPSRIVVRAAAGSPLPDLEAWSQALGAPVQAGAPWNWAEAGAERAPDLLQGEFAAGRDEGGWRARARRPAALAASLAVLASVALAADWALKARERNALVAEMHAVYRETFGAGAVVVDPPLQMQRALAALRQRNGEAAPGDFLALLGVAGEKLLEPGAQRIEEISYRKGRLAVTLAPRDPSRFGALVEALGARRAIPGHELRIETIEGKDAPRLRVVLGVEGGRWALAKP